MDGKMGNWSLALRVRLLVGIASAAVLVLAIALLGWHAYQNGRDQLVLRTLGIARVSAANAVAAIEYADPHAARELLSSLGREPGILYAELLDPAGRTLAQFEQQNLVEPRLDLVGKELALAHLGSVGNHLADGVEARRGWMQGRGRRQG